MCKIPRTSSTLCQHLINAEWQILPLWFGADHVCTTEVLRTKLELINKRTPCWRVHHQHRLQAARAFSSSQDTAHPCSCIPELVQECHPAEWFLSDVPKQPQEEPPAQAHHPVHPGCDFTVCWCFPRQHSFRGRHLPRISPKRQNNRKGNPVWGQEKVWTQCVPCS